MIQLLGDIALTGLYVDDPANNGKRIEKIRPFFNNDALKFANLETPIYAENSQNPSKNKIHTTNKQALQDVLLTLGIDVVSLANNHVYDCLTSGLEATIDALEELGILFTGAGTKSEHIEPVYLEKNGRKIACMAYVDLSTNPKTEKFKDLFINYLDVEKMKCDITKAKQQAEIVICSVHWGVDYSYYPTPKQRQIAQELIDHGATVIMGHHPHTIQPYEKYKNGHILYSLGGLTFGDYIKKDNKYGALYKKTKTGLLATIDKDNSISFQTTFEKIGNYLEPSTLNFEGWNKRKWRMYNWSQRNKLVMRWRKFNEKTLYRMYEYFFGYYQKPLARLFQVQNIKKIKKIFK
jgi:regulator of sigma D